MLAPRGIGARAHELAGLERRDRLTVEEQHGVAEDRGHLRAEREDADEVQRIGRRDPADFGVRTGLAHAAQLVERLGQRELLADEAGHEPAAADLAACFEPAQRDEQVAPRRQARLAPEQIAEHDAVAREQLPRARLDIAAPATIAGNNDHRPAAVGSERSACAGRPRSRVRARRIASCHLRTGGSTAAASVRSNGLLTSPRLRSTSTRRLAKPSAVAMPAPTSSHSASSI